MNGYGEDLRPDDGAGQDWSSWLDSLEPFREPSPPAGSVGSERTDRMKPPRIQDMEIWDVVIETAMYGLSLTAKLKEKYFYRFADKLQEAVLGFYLNIAEGSQAATRTQFLQSLQLARRSLLDTAYILTLLREKQLVSRRMARLMVPRLEELSLEIGRYELAV